jgi:hypothetical protein
MRRLFVAVATALAASGCVSPSGSAPSVIQVPPNRQFELAVGQTAQIQGTAVSLRFGGVGEDSRCASDVQCVWAGNALVRLTLGSADGTPSEGALNTTLDPKQTLIAGYTIRLVDLKPYPRSTRKISPNEYVATFEVTN